MNKNPYYDMAMEARLRVSEMFLPEHGDVVAWGATVVPVPLAFTEADVERYAPTITLAVERWGVYHHVATQWPEDLRVQLSSPTLPRTTGVFQTHLAGIPKPIDVHLVNNLRAFNAVFDEIPPSMYWSHFNEDRHNEFNPVGGWNGYELLDWMYDVYFRGLHGDGVHLGQVGAAVAIAPANVVFNVPEVPVAAA